MKMEKRSEEILTPKRLLAAMGPSPVDDNKDDTSAINWPSSILGQQVRSLFQWRQLLESVGSNPLGWGPAALAAQWQKQVLEALAVEPIRTYARLTSRAGHIPDIFSQQNEWIKGTYARTLREFCGCCLTDGSFDDEKLRKLRETRDGQEFLYEIMGDFALLERGYSTLGATGLKALKELLKCLLMVITEKPLEGEELPFMRKCKEGKALCTFPEYLEELRTRLENLYIADAFDIKAFSERQTQGHLGYSCYEVVAGSRIHSVSLRHYILPESITPNGKVLYMNTPLINKPEIFDLGKGKSVIEGMLREGYAIYLVDHGEPGLWEADLGLDFYGKTIHDKYLDMISQRHPGQEIYVMGYCMGGTLMLPYLARRVQERQIKGLKMDIKKVVLLATPFKFDDGESGHGPMRDTIRRDYDAYLMEALFGKVNVPPQVIEAGMHEIQPGVRYSVPSGFFARAKFREAIEDAAPFIYWLTHGTKFPARAHREWIEKIFMDDQIYKGTYCLPSSIAELDGEPVKMEILEEVGVSIFDYRGARDPISPAGSCVASILGEKNTCGPYEATRGGMNRVIEKNVGHIFVVSRKLLSEFLQMVSAFFRGELI